MTVSPAVEQPAPPPEPLPVSSNTLKVVSFNPLAAKPTATTNITQRRRHAHHPSTATALQKFGQQQQQHVAADVSAKENVSPNIVAAGYNTGAAAKPAIRSLLPSVGARGVRSLVGKHVNNSAFNMLAERVNTAAVEPVDESVAPPPPKDVLPSRATAHASDADVQPAAAAKSAPPPVHEPLLRERPGEPTVRRKRARRDSSEDDGEYSEEPQSRPAVKALRKPPATSVDAHRQTAASNSQPASEYDVNNAADSEDDNRPAKAPAAKRKRKSTKSETAADATTTAKAASKKPKSSTFTSSKRAAVSNNYQRINTKGGRFKSKKGGNHRQNNRDPTRKKWLSYGQWKSQQVELRGDALYAELVDSDELKRALEQRSALLKPGTGEDVELGYVTDEDLRKIAALDAKELIGSVQHHGSLNQAGIIFNNNEALTTFDGDVEITDELLASLQLPTLNNEQKAHRVLSSIFRYSTFRPGQLESVCSVLRGESSLVILPTGGGKSLCYQLPAFLLQGMTLVISPLVALMQDQLASLPPHLPGAIWSSHQTAEEISLLMDNLRQNKIKILFVSPEKVVTPGFQRFMTGPNRPELSFVAIDEAHCVAQWSHNFRPCYLLLSGVLRNVLKVRCILALTATATSMTVQSVCQSLKISEQNIIRANHPRHNLRLTTSIIQNSAEKAATLVSILKSSIFASLQSIIVYVQLQRDADVLSQFLSSYGIDALGYHAGKSAKVRRTVQEKFMSGKLRVVVATIAFGMGLDKSDVRAVLHYTLPQSLEHYVQEVGRAGRDGQPAWCHCLVTPQDVQRHRNLLQSKPVPHSTIQRFLAEFLFTREEYKQVEANQPRKRGKMHDSDTDGTSQRTIASVGDYVCISETRLRTELDIEPEVASTILAYVQTHASADLTPRIKFVSQVHSSCIIKFHGDCPSQLAVQWPAVNAILSIYDQQLPADVPGGAYTVSLAQLALLLQADIGEVQRDLLRLRWRRQCTIQWNDPSLAVQILAETDENEIATLATEVHQNFLKQEEMQVQKIDCITKALSNVIVNNWTDVYPQLLTKADATTNTSAALATPIDINKVLAHGDQQSQLLHSMVDYYLHANDGDDIVEEFNDGKYKMANGDAGSMLPIPVRVARANTSTHALARTASSATNEMPPVTLLADIYAFLTRHKTLTKLPDALALSRIALGVSSPNWQASDWKHDEFFGRYKHGVSFPVLQKYAGHALAKWALKQSAKAQAQNADEDDVE